MCPRGQGRPRGLHLCYQQIYYKLRNKRGEGGYLVLVNYQSLLSNIFSLVPPPIIFLNKRRNRLLRVSFIE